MSWFSILRFWSYHTMGMILFSGLSQFGARFYGDGQNALNLDTNVITIMYFSPHTASAIVTNYRLPSKFFTHPETFGPSLGGLQMYRPSEPSGWSVRQVWPLTQFSLFLLFWKIIDLPLFRSIVSDPWRADTAPFEGPGLASCVGSRNTEKQVHCQVRRTGKCV